MGLIVKQALIQSNIERRLVVGLKEVVRALSYQNNELLPIICLMAIPEAGDSVTHMHEVLLKAYCMENDIYILELESAEKMSRILNCSMLESCALICANPSGDSDCEGNFLDEDYKLTKAENQIVDFCEDVWGETEKSIIKLPGK
ncbi:unnamed protein product [Diamesa serratosioi]